MRLADVPVEPIPQIVPIPQVVGPSNRYDGVRLPVLRIDAAAVTRQLPPSVSAPEATSGQRFPSLARPVVDVPQIGLDYPEINVPTKDEFDAAASASQGGGQGKAKDAGSDNSAARELTGKFTPSAVPVPPAPVVQTPAIIPSLPGGLTVPDPPQAPTPAATPPTSASENGSVTLPFIGTVPLPSQESIALASTTAVTATFVAVMGKAVFEASLDGLKPLIRLMAIRIKKMRKKNLTVEEIQLEFALTRKQKGRPGIGQRLSDLKQYMNDHFFDDLVG